MDWLVSFWASLWIWLAALWVAAGQAFFIHKIMIILWKNPKMTSFYLTLAILWIALVESSAIYWLVVAFSTLSANFTNSLASIWVWLTIWLTWLWVWIWEWIIVQEASESINKNSWEKNKILSFMILFIALVESAAIYWLIVAFQIIDNTSVSTGASLWSALAIWLAWFWVAIWEWLIARKAISVLGNPQNTDSKIVVPFTILWIALTESAAIYALILSFQILNANIWISAVWVWLAIGLAWLWVAVWQGMLVSNSISKIWSPGVNWKSLIPITVLWVALVESAAIYWFIIAIQILGKWDVIWLNAIWAWLTIWLAGLWAWIGQGYIWYKAMDAITLNKELKNKILTYLVLFIALVESVAIYGLVLAWSIISKTSEMSYLSIWVAFAIWLSWLWVWIWASLLTWKALSTIPKRPTMAWYFVTIAVLWVALVESSAIYGLIISFQILGNVALEWFKALWAWLSIWLAGLWVWIAEWYVISASMVSMARNPEMKTKYLTFMILFVALIEVLAIYWLIIATQILK